MNRLIFKAVLGALVSLTALPGSAGAGTYDVVTCEAAAGGGTNELFSMYSNEGMAAYAACPRNGDAFRGLVVRNAIDGNGGFVGDNYVAGGGLSAPVGTALVGAQITFGIDRADPAYTAAFSGDGQYLPALGCLAYAACGMSRGDVWVALDGMHEFHFLVKCGWQAGCRTGSTGVYPYHRASLRVYGATVRIRDDTAPAMTGAREGMLSGKWLSGSQAASFHASDNTGIRETKLFVDGDANLKGQTGRLDYCNFMQLKPCTDFSGEYRLDTRELTDGAHTYHLGALDASGNPGSSNGTFYVDNTAPGRATALATVGGDAPRLDNSFSVRWQNPPESGVAPIAKAHYRICSAVSDPCVTGAQAGKGIQQLKDLSLPTAGEHTLRLWLEDEAGNANEATASDPVRLHFLGAKTALSVSKERRTALQQACSPARKTRARRERRRSGSRGKCRQRSPSPPKTVERVRFGKTIKLTGHLTSEGPPIGPATVRVLAKASAPGAEFAQEGLTETDSSGAFSYTAAPGPSRTLRFVYGGSLVKAPAVGDIGLVVPASSSIKVDRKTARTGQHVLFSGRLRGEPIPQVGKVVDLQAFYRDRWRTFATPRTGPRGFWRFRYKFEATRGLVKYRFRARIRLEPAYPYALGYSRQVKVAVRGR